MYESINTSKKVKNIKYTVWKCVTHSLMVEFFCTCYPVQLVRTVSFNAVMLIFCRLRLQQTKENPQ